MFHDTTFHMALALFSSLHPKIWNLLPLHIRQFQTFSSFICHLKTHYFQLIKFLHESGNHALLLSGTKYRDPSCLEIPEISQLS